MDLATALSLVGGAIASGVTWLVTRARTAGTVAEKIAQLERRAAAAEEAHRDLHRERDFHPTPPPFPIPAIPGTELERIGARLQSIERRLIEMEEDRRAQEMIRIVAAGNRALEQLNAWLEKLAAGRDKPIG